MAALLALRLGRTRDAGRLMAGAAEWACAEWYRLEAAICRVQLAEIPFAVGATNPDRFESWAELEQLGVNPADYACWAANCARLGAEYRSADFLTPRELEVVRELDAGDSFAEVARRLRVGIRTV